MVTKPEFLKVGNIVRVQHWYGEIVDVAVSDERIMVLVASPKGIWRNHPAEWLEFDPRQITPASIEDAVESFEIYEERIEKMLQDVQAMKARWQGHVTPEHVAIPALQPS